MKTITIIISVFAMVILSSCNQKTDPNAMLENSQTRTALFDAIANNHSYMTEFMDNMKGNDHAMQMMQGNQQMMGNMMKGQGMQMMMKDSMMMKNMMKDSMMMKNMMQSMMKDGMMMGDMMKMMHEKGMMSEDCMESCMDMMAEKGVDNIEQAKLELSKSQSHGDHH